MRGHIVKRSADSWSIVLSLGNDPTTGKRLRQWLTVQGTKRDAERRLSELLHQADSGTLIRPEKTTLTQYLQRWLMDHVRPNLSPRTFEGYEYIVRKHVSPSLGHIPLTQLRPEHLQRYYSEMLSGGRCNGKGGLTARSVRHHHMVIHRALQMALRWGVVSRNVADSVDAPRSETHEMQTWSEVEARRFLEAAKETPYYALFVVALHTGARRSELLALRWSDVDFIYSQLHIARTIHHLRDGSYVFRQPKTEKGRRSIALPPSATLILQEHRRYQEHAAALLGIPAADDSLVFCHANGKPLRPNTVTRAWPMLAASAALRSYAFTTPVTLTLRSC